MSIGLGVLDPALSDREASKLLCDLNPGLREKIDAAAREWARTTEFRHFIADPVYQRLDFGKLD